MDLPIAALVVISLALVIQTPATLWLVFRHQERMRVEGGTYHDTITEQRKLEAAAEQAALERSEKAKLAKLAAIGNAAQQAMGS